MFVSQTDMFFILFVVKSTPKHFDRRNMIRETWGKYRTIFDRKFAVVFLLGHDSDDDKTNVAVENEANCYNDILRTNIVDTFSNLTIKTLSTFKWISQNLQHKVRYYVITDDNCVADLRTITNYLVRYLNPNAYETSAMYCGFMYERNSGVIRGNGKMSVSEQVYPNPIYPSYCRGAMVILTHNMINDIYITSTQTDYEDFPLEDVMVYGILREKLNKINIKPVINGGIPLIFYPWDDGKTATNAMRWKWQRWRSKFQRVPHKIYKRKTCHKHFKENMLLGR